MALQSLLSCKNDHVVFHTSFQPSCLSNMLHCQNGLQLVPLTLQHQPIVSPSQLFELLGLQRSRLVSSTVQATFDISLSFAVGPGNTLGRLASGTKDSVTCFLSVSRHRLNCRSSCNPGTCEHCKPISLPLTILRMFPGRLRKLNSSHCPNDILAFSPVRGKLSRPIATQALPLRNSQHHRN